MTNDREKLVAYGTRTVERKTILRASHVDYQHDHESLTADVVFKPYIPYI